MPILVQRQLLARACNVFHGESEKRNSAGLVEMIVLGTGGTCFSEGTDCPSKDANQRHSNLSSEEECLSCTLNLEKALIVGWLVTAEMLRSSTKTVGAPWITGRTLLSQGTEVHWSCKKALGHGRKCLDPDGFCKSGNLWTGCCLNKNANTRAHELQHLLLRAKDNKKEFVGPGKPDGWMFHQALCDAEQEAERRVL